VNISRYQAVETATFASPEGDQIPYLRRRLLPAVDYSLPARTHLVLAAELNRPDLIAAVELGNAELSWVLADVNPVMRPSDLTDEIGEAVRVPQAFGVSIGQSYGE
jgi:hypothetical protein